MSWQIGARATKRLLSSCQPLEIPGNVIQSSSLKKSLCQEFPWPTDRAGRSVVERRLQSMCSNKYHNKTRASLSPF